MANPSNDLVTRSKPMNAEDLAARFLKKMSGWRKDVWNHRIFCRKKENTTRPEDQAVEQTRQSTQPWESWELDKHFFEALSRWTLQHPETSLDRILDRISDGLENHKDLFQLIPDSPFPARGLVIALSHLFILGMRISHVQREVQQFAKEVIHWVGSIRLAFATLGDGHFTREAWQNLREMRILIDETCIWVVEQLDDGDWLRIGQKFRVQIEIQEFKRRMSDARALFQDLSSISQAKGLDAILQELQRVEHREAVLAEIQKIRESQENQLKIVERERFFAQTLDKQSVPNPTYHGQGKRPCDEDTRTEVLADIRRWTNDFGPGTPHFLWLTGDPGCGKSAVTASFAQECKKKGILWAQFFINRNNVETTDPRSYFPSIARQLATHSDDVAKAIYQILKQQPTLLDDISPDQASKLFADSVYVASQSQPNRPIVIIFDGLDETSRDRLGDTVEIFSSLFTSLEDYNNVKVFISSRTENVIQKSFVLPSSEKHVKRIHLDTSHPSSIRDVSQYIQRSLLDLVREHELNWKEWPGDERLQALGERASGLFIWGVTAIKFIQEQLESHGEECIDDVLNMLTAEVLHDINTLYTVILTVTHRGNEDDWELERFRRIAGTIVFLQEPLCLDDLSALLNLRKTPSSRQANITHFVRRFRTILVSGTEVIDGRTIPRIHKSIFEFITSNQVDPKFRVEPAQAHLELAIQCLAHLGTGRESIDEDTLPVLLRYAARFWSSHLLQAKTPKSMTLFADYRPPLSTISLPFDLTNSTHPIGKPIQIRYSAETSDVTVALNRPVTWDAVSGAYKSHGQRYHEAYVNGIVFLLGGNQIVSCSNDKSIKICDATNDREIRTLVKHSSKFLSLAFSPDGKSIVTGSNDGLVHIWDCSTGVTIGQPLRGHKDSVFCIASSLNGSKIVSGSGDKTCILWDAWSGQAIGEPWAHKSLVNLVAFSGSGQRVCSVDVEHCIIWQVSNGKKLSVWDYHGHATCLSFSPTDDDVIAIGGLGGIEIQSHGRKWMVPDSKNTACLSFSPDGKEIIFSTRDTISVAEVGQDESTTHIVRRGKFPSVAWISSAAFSPKFDYFAYADGYYAMHLFALYHTKTSLKVIPIDTWARTKLAPNTDGAQKLKGALSNMKKTQHIHILQATNRRLCEITWYEGDSVGGATDFALQACVVTDDVLIAGCGDGSVLVWDKHNMEESKAQSSSTARQ